MDRSILLALAVLGLVSCWSGADAIGLPCENNSHCGRGQDCIDGFCGGEPAAGLCGNGVLDTGEQCDEGEQNAEDGACRPDCTPETCGDGVTGPTEACDLGQQNADEGACKSDCTLETCGDGFEGPTEPCDDGNLDDGDGCSATCKLESCGNGAVDPGEDCDEGTESADCDDDCTAVEWGDTNVNEAAGEQCDNETPAADDVDCMANCTSPLLWDDLEPDTPMVAWTHEKVSGPAEVTDTWSIGNRNAAGGSMKSWDSGMPASESGDTRLMSPPLDLSPLGGETIELRFDHARYFSDCMNDETSYEGAVVEVSVDGGDMWTVVDPDDGYGPGEVGDGMCVGEENPLAGQDAFTGDFDYATETFDLSAYAGETIQIGFRVAWDCGNCMENQEDRGWFIDNVVVWRK